MAASEMSGRGSHSRTKRVITDAKSAATAGVRTAVSMFHETRSARAAAERVRALPEVQESRAKFAGKAGPRDESGRDVIAERRAFLKSGGKDSHPKSAHD